MNFKAGRCPTCGGALQIPEELDTAKCMYCGGEVIVREAIRLAAGRVKEFTVAKPVEKMEETPPPFDVGKAKENIRSAVALFAAFSICGFVIGLLGVEFGYAIGIGCLVIIPIMMAVHSSAVKKRQKADEEMSKYPPKKQLIGYEGQCPYCETTITLSPNVLGDDCPACNKRIVIRDSKFYSVDTPVSGLKK